MYNPISIKNAVGKVNEKWFLPAIQRPYVWGNRYESEKYICRLFDSMYQGYPIGVIILWNANHKKVAHRTFIQHFHDEDTYENVPETQWDRSPKSLVYDGQQRLQTISSCLKYTFNNRILVFDLLYKEPDDSNDAELDYETGFRFIDKKEKLGNFDIAMNALFYEENTEEAKMLLENQYLQYCKTPEAQLIVKINISKLWNAFVNEKNIDLLAYYEISDATSEKKVNEIFERLNTGGIQLLNTDLLYSKIKGMHPDFESDVMAFAKQPKRNILLNHYDLLQLLHLAVTRRTRISDKISNKELENIYSLWGEMSRPLEEFFDVYLQEHLHITDVSIIRSKLPLFIIILFLYKNSKEKGNTFSKLELSQLKLMDKFFITAELNDWTLQSYTDRFAEIVLENTTPNNFPWDEIVKYVQEKKKRNVEISEEIFCAYHWFSLKILTPERTYYSLSEKATHRYNPELDHIFPKKLSAEKIPETDRDDYLRKVDVIWNMQPVTGDINNQKRNQHPLDYFKSAEGGKNLGAYDFCPRLEDQLWKSPFEFIKWRRQQMIDKLKELYDIQLIERKGE